MNLSRIVVTLLFLLFFSQSIWANIVLSAPPRESQKNGMDQYGPIAAELSKVLGETVVYEHPKSWTDYARDMRAGKYDIVFDGPHFANWRMKHISHVPLARLSGNLQFYIIARKEDKQVNTMKDLLGTGFCGLASPNLGTMSAFYLYNNPIIQPNIQVVKGGMKAVVKQFISGKCRAAVVSDKAYNQLPAAEKENIRIIAKSKKMPNQSITASNRLTSDKREKITAFLTSEYGSKTAEKLLVRFSKKQKFFVPVQEGEFEGLSELLEGVVYGW